VAPNRIRAAVWLLCAAAVPMAGCGDDKARDALDRALNSEAVVTSGELDLSLDAVANGEGAVLEIEGPFTMDRRERIAQADLDVEAVRRALGAAGDALGELDDGVSATVDVYSGSSDGLLHGLEMDVEIPEAQSGITFAMRIRRPNERDLDFQPLLAAPYERPEPVRVRPMKRLVRADRIDAAGLIELLGG
jgi:hypothetical protein